MGNKEWDDKLKDLLGEYSPEGSHPNWEEFSNQLDKQDSGETNDNPSFDENLKESFQAYKAPEAVAGWERIQASLDAADQRFDEDIRKRLEGFEPKYDPRTWPLFLQRFADSKLLRVKLIALKVVEVAAVLLFLFTVVNMGRMGKLPFDSPLYDNANEELKTSPVKDGIAEYLNQSTSNDQNNGNQDHSSLKKNASKNSSSNVFAKTSSSKAEHNQIQTSLAYTSRSSDYIVPLPTLSELNGNPLKSDNVANSQNANGIILIPQQTTVDENLIASAYLTSTTEATDYLPSLSSTVDYESVNIFPKPTYVKQPTRSHTEFGILAQVDQNRMRMPEDRLYTTGRWIVFPEQGIPSNGFGGGFTMAIAHPRYALESGLIYSAKTFEPNRKLAVGTAFDNGIIEFEAMRLQLVTMPLQMRYKFENKGPMKFYTLAGFGLNLIVQSNIDVLVNYHFPSLAANGDPYKDPDLAATIKESKRISEHIRDGAPFSTKTYVSITAGLGTEYSISDSKTVFLQTAFQYQIPDIEFSNNNGKQIRSISIQMGVRSPLTK